jgi:hypothetical protein
MEIDLKTGLWKAARWLRKHWVGLLIAYLLVGLAVYFAIWAFIEPLGIPDIIDADNIPVILKYRGFLQVMVTLLISSHLVLLLELAFRWRTWKSYRVAYQAHTQGPGWRNWVYDGTIAGTIEKDRRMEAIRIKLGTEIAPEIGITYQAHIEGGRWQDWVFNGEQAGTTGVKKRMEAIRIKLTNAPKGYKIFYQPYVQGYGWMNWMSDGEQAGTTGENRRLEAIRILVVIP